MKDAWTILGNFLSKLIRLRFLVVNFALRDLRSRYVGSIMGVFWAVVHPLVLLACYSLVFSTIFKASPRVPQIDDNFALFLFCGLLPWLYFHDTVSRSCDSVVSQSNLIRKTAFPSEILPLAIVLSNWVTHAIGVAVLLAVLLYWGTIGWTLPLLLVYAFLTGVLALGLGWIVAPFQVFMRDTSQLLSVVLTFWFWATPIFYQLEDVPDRLRPWLSWNPMAMVIEGYRDILLRDVWPDWRRLAVLSLTSLICFFVGGWVFRNTKRDFVDVL